MKPPRRSHRRALRLSPRITATLLCLACSAPSVLAQGAPSRINAVLTDSIATAGAAAQRDAVRAQIKTGRFADAVRGSNELLARTEREHGTESIETARALDLVVEAMETMPDARPFAERAVRIKERLVSSGDLENSASWINLGIVLIRAGESSAARAPLEKALKARERALGPDHLDVAAAANVFAVALEDDGDLDTAKSLLERTISIRERGLPPNDPLLGDTYNDLANICTSLGDFERAESLFTRALSIRETGPNPNVLDTAEALGNLGRLQYRMGRYVASRASLERARTNWERAGGPESRGLAFTLHYLGLVRQATGGYAEAKAYFERALHIREHLLGMEHPDVATSLNALGTLNRDLGHDAQAKPLLERALQIRLKALPPNHPNVGVTLRDLADLLGAMGEVARAESLCMRAVSIWRAAYGERHQLVAAGLATAADLRLRSGDAVGSRDLCDQAISIQDAVLGLQHPDAAATMVVLSEARWRLGDKYGALTAALHSEAAAREHLRLTARTLSEREALRYAARRTKGLSIALSLSENGLPDSLDRKVWDALIRSRAVVLDEMAARHRAVAAGGDTMTQRLSEAVAAASARLAGILVRGPDNDHPDRYKLALASAREERESAERALAERSVRYRAERTLGDAGLAEVAAALDEKSALIGFARHEIHEAQGVKRAHPGAAYTAFVLNGATRSVSVIPLGDADRIDSLVSHWANEAGRGTLRSSRAPSAAEAACRVAGEGLRRAIWDPLVPALAGSPRVLVVPDGALSLVPLAALPVDRSSYLIEAGPTVHYLSAERDLATLAESVPKRGGLLAIGGPAFDERGQFLALAPKGRARDSGRVRIAAGETNYRGTHSGCVEFRSIRFGPLPASLREAREVVALWKHARRPLEGVLEGAEASEAAFKAEAPHAGVLHVATHGFFLGGGCAAGSSPRRGVGGLWVAPKESAHALKQGPAPGPAAAHGEQSADDLESPLLLSGLAFAGANHRDAADASEEDGILTAEEIAALNLSGVRWAVLSACDTGVGEIAVGEGVLGLRRAFQVAGAGSLIMSLWGVEDRAARQWMRALYTEWLQHGLSTSDAARQASLGVLRERRATGASTHPFYWAGFVAAGDWR